MLFMEKKKLTMLVLGSMITAAQGEDFINAGKELNHFSSQYDFGTPIHFVYLYKMDYNLFGITIII